MQFCVRCGSSVSLVVPVGDSLPRHVCGTCGHIHYENPRLVVCCVAEWQGSILMCRRAIEPRNGYWTLPGGFMENGETTAQAACRETLEEAGADVAVDAPFAMVNIPHINQVHLFYRGKLRTPEILAGEESLEVRLIPPNEIPWHDLAFRSVSLCLERYLVDRESQRYAFHEAVLAPLQPT
ncbi:MAG: NUDIX hydrolase [Dechloromonas sp.]|nr:MAG: NUDIX hydrolase [Dechloromonas sp.]